MERPAGGADEDLVLAVQQGDAEAFGLLFERHHARIGRFLRASGVPEVEVEDLLGETFCRALARIHQFEVARGKRYLSYLYSIARNLATDRLRGRRETARLDDLEPEPVAGGHEDAIVDEICAMEEVRLIRRAMELLRETDREILTLAYDRDLSCREIQAILGKPSEGAVRTHVHKAMKRLRARVADLSDSRVRG